MTGTNWDAIIEEFGDDPMSVADFRVLDIASLPEGLNLAILDDDFPESTVRREADGLAWIIHERPET